MPSRKNSKPAPDVITWSRATQVLAVAAIFDALRYFFLSSWFFGPALAAAYCAAKTSSALAAWTAGILGAKTAAAVCGSAGAAAGSLLSGPIILFGSIMAMAVGFLGWLTVTFIMFMKDRRVFEENPFTLLWMFEGLGASVFVMVWGIYRAQIKKDVVLLETYRKENAAAQLQEKRERSAELMRAQAAQQMAEMDAANAAQSETAAEEEEIPEELREAA